MFALRVIYLIFYIFDKLILFVCNTTIRVVFIIGKFSSRLFYCWFRFVKKKLIVDIIYIVLMLYLNMQFLKVASHKNDLCPLFHFSRWLNFKQFFLKIYSYGQNIYKLRVFSIFTFWKNHEILILINFFYNAEI